MPTVRLKYETERFDSLFKRFKKAVDKSGLEKELRKREHFEKPSIQRKHDKAGAIKREQKRQEAQKLMPAYMRPKKEKEKRRSEETSLDSMFNYKR